MRGLFNLFPRLRLLFAFCLFGALLLTQGNSWAGQEPEIGTCDCTGGHCSVYMGGGDWATVDSCSSSSSSSEGATAAALDGSYLIQNSSSYELITVSTSTSNYKTVKLVPNGREYRLSTTSYGGSSGGMLFGSSDDGKLPEDKDKEGKNYKPAAADIALTESGLAVLVNYAHANFSARSIINGTQRKNDTFGVTFLYGQDMGNWDYTVSLPIKNQDNNGDFDAFDNSSFGLAVLPKYHLLVQQVHGISFDVGTVLGYEYHWYKHKSKLTDAGGEFAFGTFDNPSSFQIGPVALLGWQKGGTALSGRLSHVDFRNLSGEKAYGKNSALTNVGLGIEQILWAGGSVGFDYSHNRLHNVASADLDYNTAALQLRQLLGEDNSLTLRTSRTFSNADYRVLDTMLVFTHQL